MKSRQARSSAAALVLVFCLSTSPTYGFDRRVDTPTFGEKVVRILKKLQRAIGGISTWANPSDGDGLRSNISDAGTLAHEWPIHRAASGSSCKQRGNAALSRR